MTKRDIAKLAESWGFNENQLGKIDIVLSEMCSNLVKHSASNGEILVKQVRREETLGIEIISADCGPGMFDVNRMMEDGVSTYGSKGEGLGAIKRLSDDFDIYSQKGVGTIILSRIFTKKVVASHAEKPMDIAAVTVCKKGEIECGDAWACLKKDDNYYLIAVDGLGHGASARVSAMTAVETFLDSPSTPSTLLKNMHIALKKTRGAVVSATTISLKDNSIVHCGIGNISSRVVSKEGNKSLMSYNGTVGYIIPNTFNDHHYDWNPSSILVMNSDGLKTRWEFARYPGVEKHDASVIAAMVYKDNSRGNDDSLVLVAKRKQGYEQRNS